MTSKTTVTEGMTDLPRITRDADIHTAAGCFLRDLEHVSHPETPLPTDVEMADHLCSMVEIHMPKITGPEWARWSRSIRMAGGRFSKVRPSDNKRFVFVPGTAIELIDKIIAESITNYKGRARRAVVIARGGWGPGVRCLEDSVAVVQPHDFADFRRRVLEGVRTLLRGTRGSITRTDDHGRRRELGAEQVTSSRGQTYLSAIGTTARDGQHSTRGCSPQETP